MKSNPTESVGVWPNAYRDVPERIANEAVRNWIISRAIAYSKKKPSAPKAPPPANPADEVKIAEYVAAHGVSRAPSRTADEEADSILRGGW